MGSTKVIDEFTVHPEVIKDLSSSEDSGILYRKTYGQKPFKVILRRIRTYS